jgi:hypothetical protein
MKTTLTAMAMLALGAPLAWGEPERLDDDGTQGAIGTTAAVWFCTEDSCTLLSSEALAEAAAAEATAEGQQVEIIVVTAAQASMWQEWEFRDSVYDDWDYRDPTEY